MQNPSGMPPHRAKIVQPSPENLSRVAEAIQRSEVVGMPTETVYGLAGDSRSPLALTRIFETKERPTFDPLIVHVGPLGKGTYELQRLHLIDGTRLSDTMRTQVDLLIRQFWPGPLTLVLPKHPDVPDLATSGLSTVALRMPRHPIAQALIAASHCTLAAPSANRFGRISPTTPEAVAEELGDRIDWILDGGPCQIGLESTILGLSDSQEWTIFRHGGTPQEKIEEVLGFKITGFPGQPKPPLDSPSKQGAHPVALAPGMLDSHYAPKKNLYLLPAKVSELTLEKHPQIAQILRSTSSDSPIGLLAMSGDSTSRSSDFSRLTSRPVITEVLSPTGDLSEIARNLFSKMRALDASKAQVLFAEYAYPQQGLGYGIADRLKRASTR